MKQSVSMQTHTYSKDFNTTGANRGIQFWLHLDSVRYVWITDVSQGRYLETADWYLTMF